MVAPFIESGGLSKLLSRKQKFPCDSSAISYEFEMISNFLTGCLNSTALAEFEMKQEIYDFFDFSLRFAPLLKEEKQISSEKTITVTKYKTFIERFGASLNDPIFQKVSK